ncbi:MAG: hypothetical protein V8Q30_07580 [Acutalibacteraceae bacterium]
MIPDTCIDGSAPVVTTRKMSFSERFRLAVEQGAARSEQFTAKAFLQNFLQAMKFAQKTIGVMVPTVMLVLTLVYYTPLSSGSAPLWLRFWDCSGYRMQRWLLPVSSSALWRSACPVSWFRVPAPVPPLPSL